MNKAALETLVSTNLASASSITAAEHRAVLANLVSQLYPTTAVEDTSATLTNTSQTTGVTFAINFNKIGGMVFIDGNITNNTGGPIGIEELFLTITGNDYLPVEAKATIFFGVVSGTTSIIQLAIFGANSIGSNLPGISSFVGDILNNGETVSFNTNYKAKN